jgi:hypothetical protein
VGVSCSDKYWFGFSSGPDFSGSICSVAGPTLSLQGDEDCSGYPGLVQSEWIDTSPNAVNRIGVFAVDTTYTLFINGHEVAIVTDVYSPALPAYTLPNLYGGFVGLFLGARKDDLSSAVFDEFSLWISL